MAHAKAKLFTIGGSQAVRIPKALRLEGKEVTIRKLGNGVVIEPVEVDPWAWLKELEPVSDDFVIDRSDQPEPQERPDIDKWFE
jgi:antitoxin VapB